MGYQKVWQKNKLKKSDAQQPTLKSNETGNLRLSQAKYKHNNKKIDQKTYFRECVFNDCDWEETEKGEQTTINVDLEINGEDMGNYDLKVTYEPHREAKQNNVTTVIHWGEAIDTIKENDIVGKNLKLFKDEDSDSNYKIVIK